MSYLYVETINMTPSRYTIHSNILTLHIDMFYAVVHMISPPHPAHHTPRMCPLVVCGVVSCFSQQAVVIGAGPIGMMTALAALAGGCAKVIMADISGPKLKVGLRVLLWTMHALELLMYPSSAILCDSRHNLLLLH